MPKFSKSSLEKLKGCHYDLKYIMNEAIRHIDFFVSEGYRNKAGQDLAYNSGASKVQYPNGKHNRTPSIAVDIYPYPFDFSDKTVQNINRCYYLAGHIMAIADILREEGTITHKVRWGGDWNSNDIFSDESFRDLGHFELVIAEKYKLT